jgi:hypothetical protein
MNDDTRSKSTRTEARRYKATENVRTPAPKKQSQIAKMAFGLLANPQRLVARKEKPR